MSEKTKFYDTIAPEFDALMNGYDLQRRLDMMFGDLLGQHDLHGQLLLDAGCGTGFFAACAMSRGATVVATDIGHSLLRETRRKGVDDLVTTDVMKLAFADGTFDLVISSECIEHTPSPRDAVLELARVLRPGGVLALTCPSKTWRWSCTIANAFGMRPYHGLENWPSWWQLRRWAREGGLVVQRHVGLHLFPFVLAPTQPVLRRLDRGGAVLGPLYVNQCIRAIKPQAT